MYIAPNSDIKVLSGVPLDNTYEHTIAWPYGRDSRTRQANYFLTKVKYSFAKQYYQRVKRGWMKIQINPDKLWDCNYLMFKNTSFGDKWFYAFILSIEYINNETAQINYEIDVMQTWLRGINLDYQTEACYVERQHTATDNLYEHLVPEEIVTEEEYVVDQIVDYDMNDTEILLYVSEVYKGDAVGENHFYPPDGAFVDHVYGALSVLKFPATQSGADQCNRYIQNYISAGKEEAIICIQMAPKNLGNASTISSLQKPFKGQTLGGINSGFTPRNMKLYTFPFNKIKVNNQSGKAKEFKWELFTNESSRGYFFVDGTWAWQAGAIIYPSSYKGVFRNMEDAVIFDSFPVCAWAGNAYKAWWAQNSGSIIASNALGAFNGVAGIATGNPALVGNALTTQIQTLASIANAKHRPSKAYGDTKTSLLLPAVGALKFVITRESLRPEMLRIYDAYFTKYGYATKLVTPPAYLNRERWTYVKTIGCNIATTINNEDSHKICSIYDNGITFWRNPNEIGNYELSNNPL